MDISVQSNIKEFMRSLDHFEREQLSFANAAALTKTAARASDKAKADLEKNLDSPTAFTKWAYWFRKAQKRDWPNQSARIYALPSQAKYLSVQERGGEQRPKKRAHVIPVGQRRNRYGNMPRNTVKRLLAKPNTFSGQINGVAGIWQRMKRGGPKLLVAYHQTTRYRPRLGFEKSMRAFVKREFPIEQRRQMRRAMATRK